MKEKDCRSGEKKDTSVDKRIDGEVAASCILHTLCYHYMRGVHSMCVMIRKQVLYFRFTLIF